MTHVKSIKGTDTNIQCRGYQFEVGKEHEIEGAIDVCGSGFHACPVDQHPLAVFEFYAPGTSRYWEVAQSGDVSKKDTKLASAKITIDFELSIGDLVKRAWDYVWNAADKSNASSHVTGYQGAASSTGARGAAMASGYCGRVMGATDNAIFAVERNSNYEIVSVASAIVGKDGIEPNVWYACKNGKFIAA